MMILFKRRETWIILGLTALAAFLHFWRLGEPPEIVFDETYYAKWARDYLEGRSFFDVHPPLGKLLIATGLSLFGYNPFGWRFMGALFGTLIVPLTYTVAKKLFVSKRVAVLAALFVLLDGLLLVQTRTALLDTFVIFFAITAVAAFLIFRDATTSRRAIGWLAVTGLIVGFGLATKWTAVAPFGILLAWLIVRPKDFPKVSWSVKLLTFLLIPIGIYVLSFLVNQRDTAFFAYLKDWHIQTWQFHRDLIATHPYASRWWSWLYLARPVWYYYVDEKGLVTGVIALGNPILWWTSCLALLGTIWLLIRRRIGPLIIPLLLFLSFYLPWAVIDRTQFQYYLAPGVPFLMLILAWWVNRWLTHPLWQRFGQVVILLAILAFLFWYPLLTALPVTPAFYRIHLWFPSWI